MDTVEDIVKKGEEWREKQRLYKQKNNEKIKLQRNSGKQLEWRKKRITCDCGSVFSQQHKSTHNKSKKHTDWYLGS
jgi:hypothetical protein